MSLNSSAIFIVFDSSVHLLIDELNSQICGCKRVGEFDFVVIRYWTCSRIFEDNFL